MVRRAPGYFPLHDIFFPVWQGVIVELDFFPVWLSDIFQPGWRVLLLGKDNDLIRTRLLSDANTTYLLVSTADVKVNQIPV